MGKIKINLTTKTMKQPIKKKQLVLIENDLLHLNRLQQRLNDWHCSVKEQIRLKTITKLELLKQ